MASAFQRLANRYGLDIRRFDPKRVGDVRLVRLWKTLPIHTVLDVGANEGQFAMDIRYAGFRGEIISFEPVSSAHAKLKHRTRGDRRWSARNLALGRERGTAQINVTVNSQASSILPLKAEVEASSSYLNVVTHQSVTVETLADVLAAFPAERLSGVALKMDVQGYEIEVMAGGADLIRSLGCIYTEIPLRTSYEGEPGMLPIMSYIEALGFACVGMTGGSVDLANYEMTHIDATFIRC